MEQYYTNERNVQIVISLLKAHGIKKVVVSPGSTNVTFVASIQQDPFFEIYSCVDERSAAYMACGLAAEACSPVVLSCTGATASRNYFPALTEAFYRKLPILAITSTQECSKNGHLIPQVINRSQQPVDTVKLSVHIETVKDDDDEYDCIIKTNKAILELSHHGLGPVHLNLTTRYSLDYSIKTLPIVRKIQRINLNDKFPIIKDGQIAIYVGSHLRWSDRQIKAIDLFCESYNAVVFVDPTSNYTGKYKIPYSLVSIQKIQNPNLNPDLLIHIGEMSDMCGIVGYNPKQVWRVSEDGGLSDRYHSLTYVFEMKEELFFEHYIKKEKRRTTYYDKCLSDCERLWSKLPEIPFSQIYVASKMSSMLPHNSTVHFGILSPLRSWSYFKIDNSIETYCNQGGFGIDGNLSTMIGASLINPQKIYFGIVGDLSFFYDMNVLCNRHVGSNVRILLVNNSLAAEFKLSKQSNCLPVQDIDSYIAAAGHNGCQSADLVRHYAVDLGFEYLSASNKSEFEQTYKRFITSKLLDKPILFEVFTKVADEDNAHQAYCAIETSQTIQAKEALKAVVGKRTVNAIKKIFK